MELVVACAVLLLAIACFWTIARIQEMNKRLEDIEYRVDDMLSRIDSLLKDENV